MSGPWGGHLNGRIPLNQLEYMGRGAVNNLPQYLHPAAAHRWRELVKAIAGDTGRRVTLREGYRDYATQLRYWQTLPFPQAAYPGTSNHGWALAVDMSNYTVRDIQAARKHGPALGWDFTTADRVNEPWHLDYAGPLNNYDLAEVETPKPIPIIRRQNMALKFTTTIDGTPYLAVAGLAPGTQANWYQVSGKPAIDAINSQIPGNPVEIGAASWNERSAQFRASAPVTLNSAELVAAIRALPTEIQAAIFR